jgi:hypothetical protein
VRHSGRSLASQHQPDAGDVRLTKWTTRCSRLPRARP